MLRSLTNHPYPTLTTDRLAITTHFLHGSANLHKEVLITLRSDKRQNHLKQLQDDCE